MRRRPPDRHSGRKPSAAASGPPASSPREPGTAARAEAPPHDVELTLQDQPTRLTGVVGILKAYTTEVARDLGKNYVEPLVALG